MTPVRLRSFVCGIARAFLAFINESKFSEIGPTTLYYCVRESDEVPYPHELTMLFYNSHQNF